MIIRYAKEEDAKELLDICNKYAKIDSRIVVVNKSNSGVSQTRNVGLKYAQGQYVQFLDADDYIDRDMCKILIDNILEKKCDLVICGYTNDEIKLNKCINKIINNINDMQDDFSYLYKSFIINSPCNKIYKKELITKYFITDLSLGEDLIFNLEYFKNCKRICFIEDCLYHYITMENSLSVKVRKDGVDIALILYENLYKFCKKFQFEDNNMFVINEVLITRIIDYMNVIIDSNDYTMNEKYRILNKWINNSNVRIACKNYNSSRKSYRMINKLIENKNIF